MLKNITISVVGLAFACSLVACGGAPSASGAPDGEVGQATAELSYAHYWDVIEGGSNNGVAYLYHRYNQDATNALTSWGMPLLLEDYCADHPTYNGCPPSAGHPHPAWVRVKYPNNTWSSWVLLADSSYQENGVGTQKWR